jgi:hypothetical protein
MENLNEPFGIAQASNIIDWKIRNKVPRGETVCKELDDRILGEFKGQTVTLEFRDHGHCRYLSYNVFNGDNCFINDKNKNLVNFTLEDAVRMFGWDRKKKVSIDVSENECPWYTADTL